MSRYIVSGIDFGEDEYTFSYFDKEDSLRRKGGLVRSYTVTIGPDAGPLYQQMVEIQQELLDTLEDVVQTYRDEVPFIPGDETEDEDEEKGMGW